MKGHDLFARAVPALLALCLLAVPSVAPAQSGGSIRRAAEHGVHSAGGQGSVGQSMPTATVRDTPQGQVLVPGSEKSATPHRRSAKAKAAPRASQAPQTRSVSGRQAPSRQQGAPQQSVTRQGIDSRQGASQQRIEPLQSPESLAKPAVQDAGAAQKVQARGITGQKLDAKTIGAQKSGQAQKVEARSLGAQTDPQAQQVEAQKVEAQKAAETQKMDAQKIDSKDAPKAKDAPDAKEIEAKDAPEAKEIEAKEIEAKEAPEAKEIEAKEIEAKDAPKAQKADKVQEIKMQKAPEKQKF